MPAFVTAEKGVGLKGAACPKLTIVGKPAPPPTPADTFHDAAGSIADFAHHWRDGVATLSEIENADMLLLGMRRLIADGADSTPE